MDCISDHPRCIAVNVKRFFDLGTDNKITETTSDKVITETRLNILYHDISVSIPSCSPFNTEYLAVGHLITCGLINPTDSISKLTHFPSKHAVYVETHQKTNGENKHSFVSISEKPSSDVIFKPQTVSFIFDDLLSRSSLFKTTGASHAAALCDKNGILLWHEDIGRHNAVDKVIGHAFVKGISFADKMLALTGRINSEIVDKSISANIPIIASKAPPTDMAVKTGCNAGVTIIGFVRNNRMTVYSKTDRLKQ